MKPINGQSIVQTIAAWTLDFKKDHERFPESLADLAANKAPKHDYDPGRALKRNQDLGYGIIYNKVAEDAVEIDVRHSDKLWRYRSDTGTFSCYEKGELRDERKLR